MRSVECKKNSVQKKMLAVSATMTVGVERKHNRPLLLRDRRHKMTEEDLRKVVPPEVFVPQEEKDQKKKKLCKKKLNGNCTIPSCDDRHAPVRQNYKTESEMQLRR